MKAYILKSNKKIEPFGDSPGEAIIGLDTLNSLQKKILLEEGISFAMVNGLTDIKDAGEHIAFGEEVYFAKNLLQDFIKFSRKSSTKTVCTVIYGVFTTRTLINLQDVVKSTDKVEYKLYYFPKDDKRSAQIQNIFFDLEKNLEGFSIPHHMSGNLKYSIPVINNPIIQINHWSNIWSANLASALLLVAHLRNSSKVKLFFTALFSLSFNKWKIAMRLSKIGKNCDIHPTSYIEGSIIGDNVVVGAGTVIRESIIGNGVYIGNNITIETSVIGDKCSILNGHILYSVLYPEVFTVTHMISASLIGKRCFVGSGAVLTDFRFDGKTIMVTKDGAQIDTKNTFLGCCLGHDVYLGATCVVAPGRSIPNGLHISLEKDKIISSFPLKSDFLRITEK